METREEKDYFQRAHNAHKEVSKLKAIDGDPCLTEALEAKKELMAFRATCVSMNIRSAVKVVDKTISRINKMVIAYEKKVNS